MLSDKRPDSKDTREEIKSPADPSVDAEHVNSLSDSGEREPKTQEVPNPEDQGLEKENPMKGLSFRGPNNEQRGWIRDVGITLGLLSAGWFTHNSLRASSEKIAPVPVEKDPVASVVLADESLLERFSEEGDLVKTAYFFAEDGFIKYRFPLKDKQGESVTVMGLEPGEKADKFFSDLNEQGVEIKSGIDWLAEQALEAQKEANKANASADFYGTIRAFGAIGLLLGISAYVISKVRVKVQGGMSMSSLPGMRGEGGEVLVEKPTEGFDHIGGIQQVLGEFIYLKEDIDLKQSGDPEIELPKGVLLYGDPGTGKTMLGRALAAETACPFVSFKGSELSTQFFVGSGVARVRGAFAQARQLRDAQTEEFRKAGDMTKEGVCIVFIDEFDSIAKRRSLGIGNGGQEENKVVNTLLAELDNVNKELNKNIIVIAATNDLEGLDPAVIRQGRFNRQIEVPMPVTKESRLDVLQKAMKYKIEPKRYALEDPDALEYLSRITRGSSSADLVGILEKAVALARRERRKAFGFEDLMEGYLQQSLGHKSSFTVTPKEREVTAQHELIGHGLVAWSLGISSFLISTQPRGNALGLVIPDPNAISELAPTKKQLLQQILIQVAGTVAEEVKYGDIGASTGGSGDLDQMRNTIGVLISTGLLGDDVAVSLMKKTHNQSSPLSEEQKEIINDAYSSGKNAAEDIIKCVPDGLLESMLRDSLALEDELIGEKASEFYEERLEPYPGVREKMNKVIESYFSDPLSYGSVDEESEAKEV